MTPLLSAARMELAHLRRVERGGSPPQAIASKVRTAGPDKTSGAPIVFIADDDVSTCEPLNALICSMGWRTRPLSLLDAVALQGPDPVPCCLILDISPPKLGRLALQQRFATEWTEMPIICVAGQADISMTVRAMRAGAVDVLAKPVCVDQLLDALRVALDRSETILRQRSEVRQLRSRYALLTRREQQVMTLVVSGLMNKQVGGELGISEITVKAHRGSVMRKMEAASFAQLVQMAGRLSLGHLQSRSVNTCRLP